jgi:hypothetical protein
MGQQRKKQNHVKKEKTPLSKGEIKKQKGGQLQFE